MRMAGPVRGVKGGHLGVPGRSTSKKGPLRGRGSTVGTRNESRNSVQESRKRGPARGTSKMGLVVRTEFKKTFCRRRSMRVGGPVRRAVRRISRRDQDEEPVTVTSN